MQLGRWISSTVAQLTLTVAILVLTIFLAGFVGDVIISSYLDPYWFLSTRPWSEFGGKFEPIPLDEDGPPSWTEHFLKGLTSVGILGFLKVLLTSPLQWWLRGSGVNTGMRRAGTSGRDRVANIHWVVVVVGVATFLWVGHCITTCDNES